VQLERLASTSRLALRTTTGIDSVRLEFLPDGGGVQFREPDYLFSL
jgi:hypothetical protein